MSAGEREGDCGGNEVFRDDKVNNIAFLKAMKRGADVCKQALAPFLLLLLP